jgi:hypothetical protein
MLPQATIAVQLHRVPPKSRPGGGTATLGHTCRTVRAPALHRRADHRAASPQDVPGLPIGARWRSWPSADWRNRPQHTCSPWPGSTWRAIPTKLNPAPNNPGNFSLAWDGAVNGVVAFGGDGGAGAPPAGSPAADGRCCRSPLRDWRPENSETDVQRPLSPSTIVGWSGPKQLMLARLFPAIFVVQGGGRSCAVTEAPLLSP